MIRHLQLQPQTTQFNLCNVAKLKQDYRVAKKEVGEGESCQLISQAETK